MNIKKIRKSVDAILLKMNRMELHVSDYEWLKRQLRFISRQLDSEKSSDISPNISDSEANGVCQHNYKEYRCSDGVIKICHKCNRTLIG